MAKIERTYTIPLRKEWLKSPKYRRAKKAVTAVKDFLIKHMKSEDIKLGKYLNENIWKHGMKNPPCRIKVNVLKDDQNVVRAEIFGKEIATEKKKEADKKSIAAKVKETITGKKDDKKLPVKKDAKLKEEKAQVEEKTEPKAEEAKKEPENAKLKEEKPKEEPKPEAPKEEVKAEPKPAEKK